MTGLTSIQIMHNAWISGLFQELVDGGVMAEGVALIPKTYCYEKFNIDNQK